MLEKIILRKGSLKRHLDAPLLKEREEFLGMMFEKGISHSYLICLADKLLLYVKMFSMTDETPRKITIQ